MWVCKYNENAILLCRLARDSRLRTAGGDPKPWCSRPCPRKPALMAHGLCWDLRLHRWRWRSRNGPSHCIWHAASPSPLYSHSLRNLRSWIPVGNSHLFRTYHILYPMSNLSHLSILTHFCSISKSALSPLQKESVRKL